MKFRKELYYFLTKPRFENLINELFSNANIRNFDFLYEKYDMFDFIIDNEFEKLTIMFNNLK